MADIAARLSSVDLTTARQDPERMSTAAVRAAVRRIDQPALPASVSVVEPWLVVSGSTGRPAAEAAPRSRAGQVIRR
jgi:DNA-binding LacI/PurR family transcriptional regulator